uniref:Uncharacterized protein n=1 Tax=Meloidogyne enterolobii TaxID=390850 RepID=A0A6V7UAU7_MELEN|nr:unnamed protein product [Meloidogyne enterolobii]
MDGWCSSLSSLNVNGTVESCLSSDRSRIRLLRTLLQFPYNSKNFQNYLHFVVGGCILLLVVFFAF